MNPSPLSLCVRACHSACAHVHSACARVRRVRARAHTFIHERMRIVLLLLYYYVLYYAYILI